MISTIKNFEEKLAPFYQYNFHKQLNLHSTDVVFISGSLVEGIGNEKSDVDIFVLYTNLQSNSKFDYDFGELKTEFSRILNVNCDIEYWPKNILSNCISMINAMDFSENSRTLNLLKIDGYNFMQLSSLLHRFYTGNAVQNSEEFKVAQDSLNSKNYFKLMSRFYINLADNSFDDVIGTLENEDYLTSLHISRTMLLRSLMALVFLSNNSIDREKWVFKKLEIISQSNTAINNFYQRATKQYFNQGLSIEEDIENNIQLVNEIAEFAAAENGGI